MLTDSNYSRLRNFGEPKKFLGVRIRGDIWLEHIEGQRDSYLNGGINQQKCLRIGSLYNYFSAESVHANYSQYHVKLSYVMPKQASINSRRRGF